MLIVTTNSGGERIVKCDACGYERITRWPVANVHHRCHATPENGPGTELHKLIAELGLTPTASCCCEAMQQKMNAWGPGGCREHREEILAHLRTAYSKTDWPTKLKAGALAIAQGLTLTLDGLLDEAIQRAEQEAE